MRFRAGRWKTRAWHILPSLFCGKIEGEHVFISFSFLRMSAVITFNVRVKKTKQFFITPAFIYRDTYFNGYVIAWLFWHKKIKSVRNDPPKWD